MGVYLMGVYLMGVCTSLGVHLTGPALPGRAPHECVPHGPALLGHAPHWYVPHGRAPHEACTSWPCTSWPCTFWACTSLGLHLMGVYLMAVHLLGVHLTRPEILECAPHWVRTSWAWCGLRLSDFSIWGLWEKVLYNTSGGQGYLNSERECGMKTVLASNFRYFLQM